MIRMIAPSAVRMSGVPFLLAACLMALSLQAAWADLKKGGDEDEHCLLQKTQKQQLDSKSKSAYSAEGQDEWVLSKLGDGSKLQPRLFLEIGARDGDFFSNTRKLEEQGWTGTCVEPFPSHFKEYNRTCDLVKKALVPKYNPSMLFSNCEDGSGITGWSGFTQTNKNDKEQMKGCTQTVVPQATIQELQLPKTLDYISVDIEGFELPVLQSFPFHSLCARLWTVEGAGSLGGNSATAIHDILTSNGCQLSQQSPSDGFFECTCS
mmetsp:Transcript_73935/g.130610  ORF Transcript_73935/g.130610 Transcript_73935/m.130610 type:complete len:264 (-) Transcript_73935:65-856(-)